MQEENRGHFELGFLKRRRPKLKEGRHEGGDSEDCKWTITARVNSMGEAWTKDAQDERFKRGKGIGVMPGFEN